MNNLPGSLIETDPFGGLDIPPELEQSLQRRLRQTDTFGRIGGEEFAILLENTSFEQAIATADLLRAEVESIIVPNDPPLRVTASFGLAMLDSQTSGVRQWMAAADEALYDAKRTGRNRVSIAPAVSATASD